MALYEDFTIDRGTDVSIILTLANDDGSIKDLTGHSLEAKMKKSYNSDSANTTTFLTGVATPATDGIATLTLTNTQTDALKAGRYVYDVELSFIDSDSNTITERILEGKITVTPSVTR